MDNREEDNNIQNVSEESTPSELTEQVDVVYDTQGKEGTAVASKAVLDIILNKKIILIIGIVVIALLLFLLLLFLVNEASGGNDYIYKEASCKSVSVTYDPYGEEEGYTTSMDIEDYVKTATYAYSADFPEKYEYMGDVYFATSVALRTEALANNCKVTYRDKDLKKIKGEIVEDNVIEEYLLKSKGVVLVDENDNYISIHVADYCWTGDNTSSYSFPKVASPFEIPKNFAIEKIASDVLKNCECNKSSGVIEISEEEMGEDECFTYWSEEDTFINDQGEEETEETFYKEYIHQDYEDAFQVFGAYYQLVNLGYSHDHILDFYVREKAYYRTILKNDTGVSDTLAMGSRSSACNTSSDDANFITFLKGYETIGDYCYCGSDKDMLLATGDSGAVCSKNITGTPTIGAGVTYYSLDVAKPLIEENGWDKYFVKKEHHGQMYYDMVIQQTCVPKDVIESIQTYAFEHDYAKAVVDAANKYNVELAQYQIDALASLSWHAGSNHVDKVVKAYADGGYEGLWDTMKSVKASVDSYKKRRKGEFALFVTGDYTDQGKFYDYRGVENYDDYNSEGVLDRKAVCNINMSASGYMFPLPTNASVSCTSVFGYRNINVPGATSNHQGLDLATNGGTPIYAAKSGEVVAARDGIVGQDASNSAGNWVKLKHEDGSFTAYMHMINGSVKVSVGDYVEQGDELGEVGSTGASSGNHLHFSVYEANGHPVDPYYYLDLSSVSNSSSCKGNG